MSATASTQDLAEEAGRQEKLLFWACFLALIATAFGFVVRGQIIETGTGPRSST